jgi:malonyl-CoA O-methyltransferase
VASKRWLEVQSAGLYAQRHPLRDEVSSRLIEHMQTMILNPQALLEWRPLSGGAMSMVQLRKLFPKAKVYFWQESAFAKRAVTAAVAPKGLLSWIKNVLFMNGALCPKPLPAMTPGSVDLVWSNLALHNESDPSQVIAQWADLLRPQGVVVFSCFGPDTLKELRAIHAKFDWPEPMHPLVDMHNWGDLLVENGLSDPVMDMEYLTLTYDRVDVLMSDLRFLGRNLSPERFGALRGSKWLSTWREALEAERIRLGGRLKVSFEVIYGHAFKALPKATQTGQTQVSLEEMRAQLKNKRVHST